MTLSRSIALVLTLGLAACTPASSNPDVVTDTGPRVDTGPDTGPDRCGEALPTLFGPELTSVDMSMMATPASTGGTILDGLYYLRTITRYQEALRPQTFDRATIRVSGEYWDIVYGSSGAVLASGRYKFASSTATTVSLVGRCGTTTGIDFQYTATGNILDVVFVGTEGIRLTLGPR